MLQSAIDISLVRLADRRDVDDLVHLLREMHSESGPRDGANQPLAFSEALTRETIEQSLLPDGGAVIGVIGEPESKLQASVCIARGKPWYSERYILNERWNFVRPQFRNSHNAKILIAFSKTVASVMRMPLMMGVMSTERQAAKMRLYQRLLGVEPLGGLFVYNFDARNDDEEN